MFIVSKVSALNSEVLTSQNNIEAFTNSISQIFNKPWGKYSREVKITKHSKEWWNQECSSTLSKYHRTGCFEDLRVFKQTIRTTKHAFFEKIQEIATTNKQPWDLMNWIKCKALPAAEAIKHNGQPCISNDLLWQALNNSYNCTADQQINCNLLNETTNHTPIK